MSEFRVDELARAVGTSVRNVRVYQERGLLPPPKRVGRTGIYNETHLERLRLIRLLLQRGYTFATIGELIDAWSAGQGISDLLGLDGAIAVPWSDEEPTRHNATSLADEVGVFSPDGLRRAIELGFVTVDDDGLQVPSPRLIDAASQLIQAGVPLTAVLDLAEGLKSHMEAVAKLLFAMFGQHIAQERRNSDEVAAALLQLRPLAKQAIDAVLSLALTKESTELLAKRAGRRADEPPSDGSGGRGRTATPRSHRAS